MLTPPTGESLAEPGPPLLLLLLRCLQLKGCALGMAVGEVSKEGRGISSSFRSAALKSNNSIQVEEGWQLGGEKKEKQTIKKNQ